MNAGLLIRPTEDERRRLPRLAKLTYGKSGEKIEAELAGRLIADVLSERLDLAERIATARGWKAAA